MKKIMFNNTYGLTQAVKQGTKTMTRHVLNLTEADEEYLGQAFDWDLRESVILDRYAQYKVGEVVAIAESYRSLNENGYLAPEWLDHTCEDSAGYENKMFVRADLMPQRIRFTERRIERLRSISGADCLKEGIMMDPITGWYYVPNLYLPRKKKNTAGPTLFKYPEAAYYTLCKKLRMVLDNSANPWVIAYTFEIAKGTDQ